MLGPEAHPEVLLNQLVTKDPGDMQNSEGVQEPGESRKFNFNATRTSISTEVQRRIIKAQNVQRRKRLNKNLGPPKASIPVTSKKST